MTRLTTLAVIAIIVLCEWTATGRSVEAVNTPQQFPTPPPSLYSLIGGSPYNVSFDSRALLIAGQRTLLQSGSIHYSRMPPSMWAPLFALARLHGLNMIQTYVLWNWHEAEQGQLDFSSEGRNLNEFLRLAGEAGLFVHLRIGPYACAEWNYGGIPVWAKFIDGIEFRTDNAPWLKLMQTFVVAVLAEVEPLLARNGGPIVLAQIENEYGNMEKYYGAAGVEYVQIVADFVQGLKIEVPWVMCVQKDAPPEIINTCNGFYCDSWIKEHAISRPKQPHIWTEMWNGWFQHWGEGVPHRPIEDSLFSVARFVMRGGSFFSYYMLYGGTNYGRWVGGPMIITSYDYDVAINEYGEQNPAKFNQSRTLHLWLEAYSASILGVDEIPAAIPLGPNQEAMVWSLDGGASGVVFLANIDNVTATVTWPPGPNGTSYTLLAWSVSIVDAATGAVKFNTVNGPFIGTATSPMMGSEDSLASDAAASASSTSSSSSSFPIAASGDSSFLCLPDVFGVWAPSSDILFSQQPLEQIATTRDETDYLLYIVNVTLTGRDLLNGRAELDLSSVGDYAIVQLQQQAAGATGPMLTSVAYLTSAAEGSVLFLPIGDAAWNEGPATLMILTQTLGLLNFGPFMETYQRGLIAGNSSVDWDGVSLMNAGWQHQVGLQGESLNYSSLPSSDPRWLPTSACAAASVSSLNLVWYRLQLTLDLDADESAVFAIDLGSMNKGALWCNGFALGRYWLIEAAPSSAATFATDAGECGGVACTYIGGYDPSQCRTGCGSPSQQYYHVPRAYLLNGINEITLMEENPNSQPQDVTIVRRN